MEITIKVSTEALRKQSDQFKTALASMEECLSEISSLVYSTRRYWCGQGAEAYRSEFVASEKTAGRVVGNMHGHADRLLTIAGIYEQGEKDAEAESDALSSEVIV